MNISHLRAQITHAQAQLAELELQLEGLTEAEIDALAVEFIPLFSRLNEAARPSKANRLNETVRLDNAPVGL